MGYLFDQCKFEPVTAELLTRLNDFVCHHETDISDFFKQKATIASEEMMSKSYCFIMRKKTRWSLLFVY